MSNLGVRLLCSKRKEKKREEKRGEERKGKEKKKKKKKKKKKEKKPKKSTGEATMRVYSCKKTNRSACSLVASIHAWESLLPGVVAPEARSQLCAQRQHHYTRILHYGSFTRRMSKLGGERLHKTFSGRLLWAKL